MKSTDLTELKNLEIRYRQWGAGVTKLQGSPFSEISFQFSKDKLDMMEDGMDILEGTPVFKKEVTW